MKCSSHMKDVYESGFAVIETNLFLDTHPCCQEALSYYSDAVEKYQTAREAYVSAHGPLLMTDSRDNCYHNWVKGPWPWEGGNC